MELDPEYVERGGFKESDILEYHPRNHFRTLEFTVGYNKTDVTYGWNGYMNGLTVFHMNPQEQCHREEHSYPLVPGKRFRTGCAIGPYGHTRH